MPIKPYIKCAVAKCGKSEKDTGWKQQRRRGIPAWIKLNQSNLSSDFILRPDHSDLLCGAHYQRLSRKANQHATTDSSSSTKLLLNASDSRSEASSTKSTSSLSTPTINQSTTSSTLPTTSTSSLSTPSINQSTTSSISTTSIPSTPSTTSSTNIASTHHYCSECGSTSLVRVHVASPSTSTNCTSAVTQSAFRPMFQQPNPPAALIDNRTFHPLIQPFIELSNNRSSIMFNIVSPINNTMLHQCYHYQAINHR